MQKQEKQFATTAEQENYWQNIRIQLKKYVYPTVKDEELDYFVNYARNINLNPLYEEIFFIPLKGKYTAYIANKGYRILAVRTGEYMGQTQGLWCGEDGVWTDVWLLSTPPAAAKIGVYRKGFREAVWYVALYKNFVKKSGGAPTQKWSEMPEDMLLMRAESGALKRAFPEHIPDSPDDETAEADEIPNAGRSENAQRAAEAPKKAEPNTAFTTNATNGAPPNMYRVLLIAFIEKEMVRLRDNCPKDNIEIATAISELILNARLLANCVSEIDMPEADFKTTLDYFEKNAGINRNTLNRVLPPLQTKLSKQKNANGSN